MIENTQVGRPRADHALTLDAAKKIVMAAKGRRGNAIREYFLEQERRLLASEPPLVGHAAAALMPVLAPPEDGAARILTPMETATRVTPASARHRAISAFMYHSLAEYLAWVGIKPKNVRSAAGCFEDEVTCEAMPDTGGFGYARNELTGTWMFSRRILAA